MKIVFLGATEGVTGSMTLIRLPLGDILVDAGMSQGDRESEEFNGRKFSFDPKSIKALILTHAHLDHSGLLPRLIKEGFSGSIYCTLPTAKLIRVILTDSAELEGNTLYTLKDVQQTLNRVKPLDWNQTHKILDASFTLRPAGHILGASSVKLTAQGKTIVLSGDLGRQDDPLIPAPVPCEKCDVLIMESTYGGKVRSGKLETELEELLKKIVREKKVGIIASFAVARAQLLITLIRAYFKKHPEQKIPFYFDSPMTEEANAIYQRFPELTKQPEILSESLQSVDSIRYPRQWESIARKNGPLLIISSSGMVSGGRIFRSLGNWQDDSNAVLFLPGFQAKGTIGQRLKTGERIFDLPEGQRLHWKGEVISSEAFSSHADQTELLDWARSSGAQSIYLIHGEEDAKNELKRKLEQEGFNVGIPHLGKEVEV